MREREFCFSASKRLSPPSLCLYLCGAFVCSFFLGMLKWRSFSRFSVFCILEVARPKKDGDGGRGPKISNARRSQPSFAAFAQHVFPLYSKPVSTACMSLRFHITSNVPEPEGDTCFHQNQAVQLNNCTGIVLHIIHFRHRAEKSLVISSHVFTSQL